MYKRIVIGMLGLILAVSVVIPVFAASHEVCFELDGQVICLPIPSVLEYEFPEPPCRCPWDSSRISHISDPLKEAMANPEPTTWLIVDMEGNQAFLLDFETETLVDLNMPATR